MSRYRGKCITGWAGAFILTAALLAGGCNWNGQGNTPNNQNPVNPTGRRTTQPAPTKNLPGLRAADRNSLRRAVSRIKASVQRNDWAAATRESNNLGALWTKFKPSGSGNMSATEMAAFDSAYAKLQKDVRAKNRAAALRDAQALNDTIAKM